MHAYTHARSHTQRLTRTHFPIRENTTNVQHTHTHILPFVVRESSSPHKKSVILYGNKLAQLYVFSECAPVCILPSHSIVRLSICRTDCRRFMFCECLCRRISSRNIGTLLLPQLYSEQGINHAKIPGFSFTSLYLTIFTDRFSKTFICNALSEKFKNPDIVIIYKI